MRFAVLIACVALLPACSGGGDQSIPVEGEPPAPFVSDSIVRGPQLAQARGESIVVAWRSEMPVVAAIECSSGQRLEETVPTTDHVFTLTGLAPDTSYGYALGHDGSSVAGGQRLLTAPATGVGPVRFVVVGDCGSGDDVQRDVATDMAASDPDLVLIAGDVIYVRGAEDELDPAYFVPYRSLIRRVPFYPALGNHDVATDNGRPLLDSLHLPRNSADGSERFYSFDRGPVHFVALNSNQELAPGTVQGDWLAADLAGNTRAWTVIYLHHPPYSSSLHGSDSAVRAALVPLCDLHGVDVVFSGHDHVYERTHPLAGDAVVDNDAGGDYTDPPGTVYVVTGGGGRGLYESGTSAFTAVSEAAHHHVVVEVDGSVLSLYAIARGGGALDSMSITKTR